MTSHEKILTQFPLYYINLENFCKWLKSDFINEIPTVFRVDLTYPSAYINPSQYADSAVVVEKQFSLYLLLSTKCLATVCLSTSKIVAISVMDLPSLNN